MLQTVHLSANVSKCFESEWFVSFSCRHRVSENHDNKMSPNNLGIVFGPTLLRPLVSTDVSMIALLETAYQAELIEFLITHHGTVFGLQERPSTPPPPVPTAPLPDTPPRASCPLESNACHQSPEREHAFKERPRSLEVSTIEIIGTNSQTYFRAAAAKRICHFLSAGARAGVSILLFFTNIMQSWVFISVLYIMHLDCAKVGFFGTE